jgi:hypothetical protein
MGLPASVPEPNYLTLMAEDLMDSSASFGQ